MEPAPPNEGRFTEGCKFGPRLGGNLVAIRRTAPQTVMDAGRPVRSRNRPFGAELVRRTPTRRWNILGLRGSCTVASTRRLERIQLPLLVGS